jgi:hypothetical protein
MKTAEICFHVISIQTGDLDGDEEKQGSLSRRQLSEYSNQIDPNSLWEFRVISLVL